MLSLLRQPVVSQATGMARPTLYEAMAEGLFPRPIKCGPKFAAWPSDEIAAINAARIAGKTDAEIRELVAQLEQQRTAKA